MKITLIFRSDGVGFSLENLFQGIARQLEQAGAMTVHTATAPYISHSLVNVWKNIIHFRAYRHGVVHITGDIHYVAIALTGRQTVLTIPDSILLERNRGRPIRFAIFWLLWYYWPIRKAAIVTTISEKSRRELGRYVGSLIHKVRVIPCHYRPEFSYKPQPFDTENPTLLHIGTAPHKNLHRLTDALAGLACRLLIVGQLSETEKNRLNHQQIDYEHYVAISPADIVILYNRCDVVTFVSLYEGFGMPIIEAQAVGRPVVTSQLSPMTEVGGPGGACYVDPTDVRAIRAGILRVWQDAAYRDQLVQAGRLNAQRYTLEQITAHYAALYQQLND